MPGDPLFHVNADARNLAAASPHPCEARIARGGNTEPRQRVDERLLERAEIPMQVLLVGLEVENRIADELSRPVKCHTPAALDLEHVDAMLLEDVGRV